MELVENNKVVNFLENKGYALQPHYFLDSKFKIGHEVDLGGIRVAFRAENESSIVICDLVTLPSLDKNGLRNVIKKFITFAHEIVAIPGIKQIKGMMIKTLADTELNVKRAHLAKVLLTHGGAKEVFENGQTWLILKKKK